MDTDAWRENGPAKTDAETGVTEPPAKDGQGWHFDFALLGLWDPERGAVSLLISRTDALPQPGQHEEEKPEASSSYESRQRF